MKHYLRFSKPGYLTQYNRQTHVIFYFQPVVNGRLLKPGKYFFFNAQTYCKVIAVSLHFMLLSAFCWMLCEGVLLYCITTVMAANHEDKIKYFYLLGWGE